MPGLTPREVLEIVAVASIIIATLYKLASLYHHTRRWNGLGKALRDEKWTYVAAWAWLLLKEYWAPLDRTGVFVVLAVAVVIAEIRVTLFVPRVWIRHDRPPGGPTV